MRLILYASLLLFTASHAGEIEKQIIQLSGKMHKDIVVAQLKIAQDNSAYDHFRQAFAITHGIDNQLLFALMCASDKRWMHEFSRWEGRMNRTPSVHKRLFENTQVFQRTITHLHHYSKKLYSVLDHERLVQLLSHLSASVYMRNCGSDRLSESEIDQVKKLFTADEHPSEIIAARSGESTWYAFVRIHHPSEKVYIHCYSHSGKVSRADIPYRYTPGTFLCLLGTSWGGSYKTEFNVHTQLLTVHLYQPRGNGDSVINKVTHSFNLKRAEHVSEELSRASESTTTENATEDQLNMAHDYTLVQTGCLCS